MSPFILFLIQEPTTPPTPQTPPALVDLRVAPVVAETSRIRLTPSLDGKIEEEEWDGLGTSGETKTYLQWEPGAIHVAAAATMGKDLLVSIDSDGNGWLVGRNNLEARIGTREGKPFVTLRLLDASNVAGPVYRDMPGLEGASRAVVGTDGTIEASIVDPGLDLLPRKNAKVSIRVDVVPSETPPLASNEPRALAAMRLTDYRAAALPTGLKTTVDFNDVATVPGEEARVRFNFSGAPMPKRIALRSEGLGREATTATELPFPPAGKKGVGVEYKTRIVPGALVGYRIVRATLTGDDGVPAVLQASYRVAPPADVTLKSTRLPASENDRSIRVGFVVQGNSRRRTSGKTTIAVPSPYRITNGSEAQRINLAEPRLPLPKGFDLFVPANSHGTIPITFSMEIDGQKFEVVRFVTID